MSSKGGSSRRKPQVVRKVFDDSDENENDENSNTDKEVNEEDDTVNGENMEVNGDEGIPDELPEGTVVVEPEAVEDNSNSSFKGPEFSSSKRKSDIGYLSIVTCTACGKQINTNQPGEARRHPDLKVLTCRSCYKFFKSGPITQDEDGLDEQCRWCSEGGKLFGCDFCNNTFCKSCIVRNLGRSELSILQDEDSQWKCYMCNPKPLYGLVENCNQILEKIAQEKEKEKQKILEPKKKSVGAEITSNKTNSNDKGKTDTPKTNKDGKKSSESDNKNKVVSSEIKTEKKSLPTVKSLLTAPVVQSQQPPVNTKVQYVYLPTKTSNMNINADTIFGNSVNPRNIHAVIDKLISVTHSLKLLLSSIRVNIQNDQEQDYMMSGITFENRKKAVECVKSGVDLFLDELKQIDKISNVIHNNSNTGVANQSYPSVQNAGESIKLNSSSLLAATLTGNNTLGYENIQPKPNLTDLDVSQDLVATMNKKDDTMKVENDTEMKAEEKEEMENNDPSEINQNDNTSDIKGEEEPCKDGEEKMEVDGNESTAKTANKEDGTKTENKSNEDSTEESDTSSSDESDDESDEVSSGDFDESWGGTKRRKTRQAKKKEESTKKDKKERNKKKKKEKEKEKSKGKLNISFKFGSKKKKDDDDDGGDDDDDNDDGKEDSKNDSENDFENSNNKSKKSKDKKGKAKSKSKKNSENSDSELEDEIDKLSKDTTSKKKKKAEKTDSEDNDAGNSDNEEDKEKVKKETKKSKKDKKEKKKGEKKTDDSSSDDDDDDDGDDKDENYDDETEEEKEDIGDLPFDKNDEDTEEEENKDENVKAKEDLLKELNDSTTEDGSSDSEVVINSPKKKKKKKSDKEADKASDDTDSDVVGSPKKKTKTRSSLLEAKISDSDSDFQTPKKKRGKKRKASSSEDKSESDSDSDSDKKKKKGKKGAKGKKEQQKGKRRRRIKKQSSSSEEENASEEGEGSDEESQTPGGVGKRKKIRKVKSDKKLTDATKEAVKAEEDRRKRIADRQKQFNNIVQEVDENSPVKCPMTTQLVLEEDKETKKPIIEIDKNLVRKLKPHQVEAVQFIWDCTMETLERAKKEEGAGCILAHCMGLGKTLTLVTFIHTMLVNGKKTKMKKALVVCPLNTVLNWQREFEMWQEYTKKEVEVFELSSVKQNFDRAQVLQNWHNDGGVMIMGYEMFRILSGGTMCRNKKQKQIFAETLVDPGPDLVVCDEGHILKNDTSSISKAMNKIKSKRRVVLTGTPLQNNLVEYHCMVNFVKPNLLGTSKEFRNRFVNPISNGQCADSTPNDVKVMKRRAHILHEKLAGCVQRKDYSALTKFLPQKHEYVISVRLSKVQIELYSKYLNMTIGDAIKVSNKGGRLFQDYQNLMRIWTHPWVLKMDEVIKERKALFEEDDEFIDDSMSESDSDGSKSKKSSSSSSDDDEVIPVDSDSDSNKGRKTRSTRQTRQRGKEDKESENSDAKEEPKREVFAGEVVKKWTTRSRGNEEDIAEMLRKAQEEEENKPLTTEWWAEFVSKEDFNRMELSGKLMLLFEILRMCEEIGDKILVFSQSLLSLDLIEDFLEIVDNKYQEETKDKTDEELVDGQGFGKHWTKGEDYFRMDGSTSAQQRKDLAIAFNDPENYRARLFLISTKAGSLGINLVGANRVIIFDASWNPSHDVQSIFRVYRFGQTKPVYVYRFLAQATMEEKIYERQIIKLSLSQRVVDEHQIERHFNASDLQELYTFNPDRLDDPNKPERPTPVLPKDHMLAELFKSHKDWIVTYHEHDSLLENKTEEELSEEERKAAWEDYEQEQKGITMSAQNFLGNMRFPMPGMNQMGFNMPMPNMRMPGQPGMPPQMALNHHHLLQLVQEMKAKFPFLPQEQLTARVQGVIRSMLANQIMQQHDVQRRQIEQQEMQHQQQLQQIQAQIRRQQQQMNMRHTNPSQQMRMGMNPNSNFGGMRPRMGQPHSMRSNNLPGSMMGNGTSSNPINLEEIKSPPSGSRQGNS